MPVERRSPSSPVGLAVLVSLEADEGEAQEEGEREKEGELAALSGAQRMVRDRDRKPARQQDRGVQQRNANRGDDAEAAVLVPADVGRAVGRPGPLEVRPEDVVGEYLDALPAQPRHREHARVEQRAEEGTEEHDLREDEPHHPHAE